MAQIIPPITSLPIDSSAAPSVEDIQDRLPSICVDYLSHDWSEEDVWASWRNMTRHKHEIANGVRLENASWRTWQKQRNKLKTISPETLNWLKDSDVTWLYGPLHTANVEPVRPLKVATTDERLGIDRPNPNPPVTTKPILKHRTLSEMLTGPRPSSPILEATSRDEINSDSDLDRPMLLQSKSDTNVMRARTQPVTRERSPPRDFNLDVGTATALANNQDANNKGATISAPGSATDGQNTAGGKKHISFNTFVEQVIALDEPREQQNNNLDSSDDEMLEMKPSSLSSSSRSSRPSLSRNSSSGSNSDHLTIAKIAPTVLKTLNLPGSSGAMIYAPPPEYQSPSLSHHSQQSFDFPSPQVDRGTGKWADHDEDEDDYGSAGFDYFGGPNLAGEDDRKSSAQPIPIHVGASPNKQAQAQQQQQQQSQSPSVSVEPSSVSSNSSSSSSLNAMSPQPGRSILKIRSPQTQTDAIPEPSSPPMAYFNYTPSAATGIGGMRSSSGAGGPYDYSTPNIGPTGSPQTSPTAPVNVGEEQRGRGRTPSRDRGLNDRSTSRGTSTSSTGSFGSASSARSPTESYTSGSQQVLPRKSGISASSPQLDKVQEGVSWEPPSASGSNDEDKSKDHANYVPDRSDTPTPHSSPQISLRPLKDTSPASLPHSNSTSSSSSKPTISTAANMNTSDLPKADPPTIVSPTSTSKTSFSHDQPSSSSTNAAQASTNAGKKATIAHVGTNAQPTLSHQPLSGPAGVGAGVGNDDDDGASIMGRAANIASTAKDLLGALWYGNEGGVNTRQQHGGSGVGGGAGGAGGAGGGRAGGHRRGASLG
ncbi:hypothetical protein L486_06088 [Kwoniella mangroviensis CBS 10435]|uniref:Nitrogen regulatory protein areA GATA-like domain-containing protein n=1 Tax=Kwoniella mangroviensis CBS 10435 TaxID=1331196 RepID=A0A1B9IKX1_9TREE|nr:hypothetical protein L486_06088 [Kwoniella mangroviensis CBS 10435]